MPEQRAWKELNYENLKWNVEKLKELLPEHCAFMAVVKADAYGHGALPVSSYLNRIGVRAFAVATLQESIALRKAGIQGEILIMGYTPPQDACLLTANDLIQTAADCAHARALNAAAPYPVKVHLKIDTGMHRLGERAEHIDALASLFSLPRLRILGMYSHLCVADSQEIDDILFTRVQISSFLRTAEILREKGCDPGKLHLQSSYGVLNYPGLSMDYARFGIAMYGVLSSPDSQLLERVPLRPVLSLHARIATIRDLHPGETVSYGRHFRAEAPMRAATVTIGYADGLPRSLSGTELPALVRGRRAHVIGNICMDQLIIDVTGIPEARPGDVVTFLGTDGNQTLRAEEMAEKAGTITNELLCRLHLRKQ
ncbi:alanine racemase [Lachnoclostridium sp. An138]|nr:alanine racemase [Lachnoclostridium sp. An138]